MLTVSIGQFGGIAVAKAGRKDITHSPVEPEGVGLLLMKPSRNCREAARSSHHQLDRKESFSVSDHAAWNSSTSSLALQGVSAGGSKTANSVEGDVEKQ